MSSFPHQPGLGLFLKASGLIKRDVKGRMAMCLYFSPDPPLSKERICKRGYLLAGCPFVELCLRGAKMRLGLPPQRGGILGGAHSALSALLVTGNTDLSISPAAHGKRKPSIGKGEREEKERLCMFLFICVY